MTEERKNRLLELLAKATPRPWRYDPETDYVWGPSMEMIASDIGDGAVTVRGVGARLPMEMNGELMCAAINEIAALLDNRDGAPAILANRYTEDQGMDNEMENYNAGLEDAVRILAGEKPKSGKNWSR